jgi:hypothetical protein
LRPEGGGQFHHQTKEAITMDKDTTTTATVTELRAARRVEDAADIEALWLDPTMGDGITDTHYHSVPVGKPKDFFRTVTDPAYRRRTEIYTHKQEGVIDVHNYIIGPAIRGLIDEAMPCTIVTVVYRDGTPRLWPIKFPKDGGSDIEAWRSARAAAKIGMERWTKLVWARGSYKTRDAQPGYAPDPDFTKLPSFNELVRLAFGEHGVIRDADHPIYRELFGNAPVAANKDVDGGELDI